MTTNRYGLATASTGPAAGAVISRTQPTCPAPALPMDRRGVELALTDIAQRGVLRADHGLFAQPGRGRPAEPRSPGVGRVTDDAFDTALALKGLEVRDDVCGHARPEDGDQRAKAEIGRVRETAGLCGTSHIRKRRILPAGDEPDPRAEQGHVAAHVHAVGPVVGAGHVSQAGMVEPRDVAPEQLFHLRAHRRSCGDGQ